MNARGGLVLGKVGGVEIQVDWSLFIIFALITVNLGAGVFPSWHPGWGPVLVWATAVGAAVLFFVSILAHELSHAIVARWQGIPVNRITLFLFGGMAHMESEPKSPKAELLMAAVGPVVSIGIGIVATLVGAALAGRVVTDSIPTDAPQALAALHAVGPVATLLLWLGPINFMLGVFNLVPGFPLDGGRVFRAIAWWVTGDLTKATRWAATAGQAFAVLLMAIGAIRALGGDFGQGLWMLLIGWFLNNAARMSYRQLLVKNALEDVPVSRVMRTQLDRVPPDISVEELVRDHVMLSEQRAFPVEADGVLVGLVCFEDIRRLPQTAWAVTPVTAIMTPAERLTTLPPDADAEQALEELARREVEQIPVTDGNRLLGLVRQADLVKWLALHGSGPLPSSA